MATTLRPIRGGGGRLAVLALPLAFVGGAVLLKLALGSLLAGGPFLLLAGAVVASAWYGGARSGVVAIALSTGAAAWLLPPTGFTVAAREDAWALLMFVAEMTLITVLVEQAREARRRAERAADTARLVSAERQRTEILARQMETGLAALNRLGTALLSELEPHEVALLAVQGAATVSGGTWAALSFERPGHEDDPVREGTGAPDVVSALLPDAAVLRTAVGQAGVVRVGDVRLDPALARLATERLPVRSLLLASLDGRSGRGLLAVGHPVASAFDARHQRLLGMLALHAASALDNAHHHSDAQRALAAAQVAGRMKDEFLSTLSHELRTPLNAILGWAHLLQGRQLGPEDSRRAVETIVRNAALQEGMIRELLDMSSLLNGRLRLQVAPLDLRGVVDDAVATARSYARTRGVEVQLATPPAPVPVVADSARLQQVVWSLLSNAVKFTPAGGRVRVSLAVREGGAELVVDDSGAGMDREFLARLFSRFLQADSSSTRPSRGLGLGLAVARGLVELHDGELLADSPGPGLGSTFTVRLPLYTDAAEPDTAPTRVVTAPPPPALADPHHGSAA